MSQLNTQEHKKSVDKEADSFWRKGHDNSCECSKEIRALRLDFKNFMDSVNTKLMDMDVIG